jgi:hypothetical protein
MTALLQINPHISQNPAFDPVAKLRVLHDEAREIAMLANLLGRAPYAASFLGVCVIIVSASSLGAMPKPELATWSVLMLIGVGAMLRSYRQAIAAPFERSSLRNFARDFVAISAYSGFAWGAGAYLALQPTTPPMGLTIFAALPCILMALTLRHRETVVAFIAPVAALAAFASVVRPLPEGPLAAAFVLIACAAVGGATFWILGRSRVEKSSNNFAELAVS